MAKMEVLRNPRSRWGLLLCSLLLVAHAHDTEARLRASTWGRSRAGLGKESAATDADAGGEGRQLMVAGEGGEAPPRIIVICGPTCCHSTAWAAS